MNKTLTIALVVTAGIVVIGLIFGVGMLVGHHTGLGLASYGPVGMMSSGYNMMGGNGVTQAQTYRTGVGANRSNVSSNVKPLTVDQVKQAVASYLKGLNNPDLELKEIMIFDNNAYARITEKSTGIGAMELLVDPPSLSVYPEYGPNMMWNLKYGHMSGSGMMSGGRMMGGNGTNAGNGMMGGSGMMGGNSAIGGYGMMGGAVNANPASVSATMTVTADQAVKIAQQYLDKQFPGYQAATDPDPFYGYYTIDILKDGKPTGMLSVNGFSSQVFLHTWHGTFIEVSE